jgi:hypothetical protein
MIVCSQGSKILNRSINIILLFLKLPQLKLYGKNIIKDQMLDKTLYTFYASNIVLQQQYR